MADFFAGKYYVDMLTNVNCPIHGPTQAALQANPTFVQWGDRYKAYIKPWLDKRKSIYPPGTAF